jgi:hypothetical protein
VSRLYTTTLSQCDGMPTRLLALHVPAHARELGATDLAISYGAIEQDALDVWLLSSGGCPALICATALTTAISASAAARLHRSALQLETCTLLAVGFALIGISLALLALSPLGLIAALHET